MPPLDGATAQTLNYALGNLGGKQKSWMVLHSNAPAPPPIAPAELTTNPLPFTVRGRGRPRKYPVQLPKRPPRPQTTVEPNLPPRPTVEPHSERLPSSNSTSPQLANVVNRQSNVSHGPSAVTVFPSPTPSEENTGNAVAMPSTTGEDTTPFNLDFLDMDPADGNHAPDTPLETVFMDAARREIALSKRPMEGQEIPVEKRSRVGHLGQERPAIRASMTGAPSSVFADFFHPELPRRASGQHSQTGSPMLGQLHSRSPSISQASNGQMPSPQIAQGMQFRDPQASRTPPQPQVPLAPTSTSSAGPIYHTQSMPMQTGQTSNHQRVPSAQRSATPSKTWYTMQDCLLALDKFQASNPVSPNHPRDGRRLAVLRDATEHMDWPYLTMHQYYCLLSSCPEAVPQGLRMQPNLHHALRVMHDVLDANETLSPSVLHFFSNYPYSQHAIAAMYPATFQYQSQLFLAFIAHSPYYDQLKQICESRRCPPLTHELALDIRIPSTTFQHLLFTAFLRCIWRAVPQNSKQSRFEADAVAIFKQNQQDYYQQQVDSVQPPYGPQEREREFQLWGSRLKELVEGFEAVLRARRSQITSLANQHIGVPQQPSPAYPYLYPQPPQIDPSSSLVPYQTEMQSRQNRSVNPHSAQAAIQQSRGRGRPPTRSVQPPRTIAPQQVPPAGQRPQGRKSILPPADWRQSQQRIPNPARFSLHQAHLQSPVLRATSVSTPLYTFSEGYIKAPTRLAGPERTIETWTFSLSAGEMQTIPQTVRTTTGAPGLRDVDEQSKIVRLRCVKWPGSNKLDEHAWATADTSWIPHSYLSLNDTPLQQRKKVHNGKDLPIDITGLLKEGENVLQIAVMAPAGNTAHLNYFLAIEAIGVSSHESIKKHCLEKSHFPAEQVLQSIKSKLSGTGDDDEISIVESTLTIGLFDPFSQAKFCDIPVRSRACPHNDCFDLETFLVSRTRNGDASVADQWKCPICNSDARPHMLLVDGFLEDVKKQLEAQNLSRTRHIIVHQDGSWKPKAEVREGVSDDPPTPTMRRASVPQRDSVPADAEIIDLSD
jgi:hypothetical protein